MQYIFPPTVHIRDVGQSLNQHMFPIESRPTYWAGPTSHLPVVFAPKLRNDISLKAHGNIGENLTSMAPAANSTNFLAWKRFIAVRSSPPYGYTSGRAIAGLFAPTSAANVYLGRTNV